MAERPPRVRFRVAFRLVASIVGVLAIGVVSCDRGEQKIMFFQPTGKGLKPITILQANDSPMRLQAGSVSVIHKTKNWTASGGGQAGEAALPLVVVQVANFQNDNGVFLTEKPWTMNVNTISSDNTRTSIKLCSGDGKACDSDANTFPGKAMLVLAPSGAVDVDVSDEKTLHVHANRHLAENEKLVSVELQVRGKNSITFNCNQKNSKCVIGIGVPEP